MPWLTVRLILIILLMVLLRTDDSRAIDDHRLVNSRLGFSPFDTLISNYSSRTHVKIEKAHPAHVATIAAIAPKAGATAVAHPEGWLVAVFVLLEHTVIVYVVTGREG